MKRLILKSVMGIFLTGLMIVLMLMHFENLITQKRIKSTENIIEQICDLDQHLAHIQSIEANELDQAVVTFDIMNKIRARVEWYNKYIKQFSQQELEEHDAPMSLNLDELDRVCE